MAMTVDQVRGWMRYRAWRQSVPWSNAEVVAALRQDADEVPSEWLAEKYRRRANKLEQGARLSSLDVRRVADRLITTCEFCGKKAFYRTKLSGRCREHRNMPSEARAYHEQRSDDRAEAQREAERKLVKRDRVVAYSYRATKNRRNRTR